MKYSIITAVYNREDCIARCIKSVIRNLNYCNDCEHIIVDDCSTDGTANIIYDYSKKYSHIKFEKFTINKGTNAARNYAISKACGKYCIILDSDDYFIDNALQIIDNVISKKSYNYYVFCPNDMIDCYNYNELLQSYQVELSFKDFLLNKVSGDFIHVMPTEIIRNLPFNENLRIYEGVFFLRFYKQVNKILFTKEIVTIRERSRKDSVTREVFRTNKISIQKNIIATNILINWFYSDYLKYNAKGILIMNYLNLIENYILLSDYVNAKTIIGKVKSLGYNISPKTNFLYYFRVGFLYRILLKFYLIIKYSILNKRLK